MPVKFTVKVDLGGVDEKLKNIGPKLARSAMRKAFRAVGVMWIDELKSKVAVDTGDLRDSIGAKIRTRKGGRTGSVTVGPAWGDGEAQKSPGLYGQFVEFGTRVSQYPKQPFMRPVYDATADKAVQLFADVLKSELGQVADSAGPSEKAQASVFSAGMSSAAAAEMGGGDGDFEEDIGGVFNGAKQAINVVRNPRQAAKRALPRILRKLL